MAKKFTTLFDSFGTPIHEGDTIEYFDWCYAHDGVYKEGQLETALDKLPSGFIDRAKQKGYTAVHKYHNVYDGDCVEMMKPCVGVVKWNKELVTYEPVVNAQEDYNNNSFYYVVNSSRAKQDGSYCKVISSNVNDNE